MAKKEKKQEEIVDLTPKPEKVTEDQLKRMQEIVNKINQSQMEVGVIESRKHNIMHYINSVQDELTRLTSEFESEYGTSDINIQDGTIRYSKENGEVNKED